MSTEEMPERWAIWIDIEGFAFIHEKYNAQSYAILGRMTEDLFRIGGLMYPESPERLFIHQLGDGFIIISDFMEKSLERPIAIAIGLMRSMLSYGGLTRSGISSGDFADISGCLPPMVRDVLSGRALPVGRGRMTIMQVMGGALINAHATAGNGPRGPSLRIDRKFEQQISSIKGLIITDRADNSLGLNWLLSDLPLADQIVRTIRGRVYPIELLTTKLNEYLERFNDVLSDDWKGMAHQLLVADKG